MSFVSKSIVIFSFIQFYFVTNVACIPVQSDKMLEKIQMYINSISNLRANFEETDIQKGVKRSGILSISRPGKMKWEYIKPEKKIIIAHNNKVTYYDYALEELSVLPVKSSLLNILSKAPLDLRADCKVLSIYEDSDENYVDIALTDKNAESENAVVLKFRIHPNISLLNIAVLSDQGEILTEISLTDIKYDIYFTGNDFSFQDPKFFDLQK